MNTVPLLGINFYKGSYRECLKSLTNTLGETKLVVTPNPEMLYEASRDESLMEVLQGASIAIPDGAGIFVAYQITQSHLPKLLKYLLFPYWCVKAIIHDEAFSEKYGERITGARLTRDLLAYAQQNGTHVTIIEPIVLGNSAGDIGKRESQETITKTLEKKFPGMICRVIVSDTCPETMNDIQGTINNGIIFATHGGGKQEKLLADLIKNGYSGLALGVGGSIDLITGFRSPAPAFFQRFGGEWLYRLYKNPTRHGKRMKSVITFLIQCF